MITLSAFKLAAEYDYASLQAGLDPVSAVKVKALAAKIADDDLYKDESEPDKYGREDHPHITVFYGIHTENADVIKALVGNYGEVSAWAENVSVFNCDKYDVVKIDVDSLNLQDLHKLVGDTLKTTETHPEYKPHITLAYVKKGKGDKYTDLKPELDKLVFKELEFSDTGGALTRIPLGVTKSAADFKPLLKPWKPSVVKPVTLDAKPLKPGGAGTKIKRPKIPNATKQ